MSMLPSICKEGDISRRTNHSLQATGATEMFSVSIPEKVIQSRTGHQTLANI